jgi:myo-inositol-1(or 4)-monophosphatase
MIGSATLSLALVAEGVFDAYFEEDIMLWDIAAGLALVKAAGGWGEVKPGRRPHSVFCTGTNGQIPV